MDAGSPRSAYGITWYGLGHVAELDPGCAAPAGSVSTGPVSTGPVVSVSVGPEALAPAMCPVGPDDGCWRLADGRLLHVDREVRTATFHGPPLDPDRLAHPYLAPVATVFSRWAGREAFHAGSFVAADRAWIVLGPRTAGKSTLMACLAARATEVLSDDMVITDGDWVWPGPRCVDLRDPLPYGDLEVRPARDGTRCRVILPPGPDRVPVGGWFFLEWGDRPELTRIPAAELIGRLATRRAWRTLSSDPAVLLALAAAPAWTLRRPRSWDQVPATLALVDTMIDSVIDSVIGSVVGTVVAGGPVGVRP